MMKLVIELQDNGMLHLEAPDNIMQAYGLIELAKDAIRMRAAQQQKIAPPMPADIALLRGGRG